MYNVLIGERIAYRKSGESTVGRPEREVTRTLGKPLLKLRPDSEDYPIKGYGKPRSRTFDHVWVYFHRDVVLYVYFDRMGTVTATELTGG